MYNSFSNELYNFLDENGNYISSIDFVYASGFLDNDTSIIVTEKGEKNYIAAEVAIRLYDEVVVSK